MTTATTSPADRYELVVTRIAYGFPLPVYETFIYRTVYAGVCGPFTEPHEVQGMGAAIQHAADYGFVTDGWPEIGGNTATYRLVKP